ncbi:hypothetical protein BT63DRAFT_425646 [Microthyrium microscopicum]|uniref:Uncharacterized protein n=1 Tax=Microthyrium microscopicum TaxID=703497 RepID=A0A6A6UBM3_9PEZI|nr:hypothetical protein BT63DRAFT_425646 [Microthyrium microscopicum]
MGQHDTKAEAMLNLSYSDVASIFPDFAMKLFDSTIHNNVPGPYDGKPVYAHYAKKFPTNEWIVSADIGQSCVLFALTEPFSIARYSLTLKPKEIIMLDYSQPSRFRRQCFINFREQSSKIWQKLTGVVLRNPGDTSVVYEFLYTYTGHRWSSAPASPQGEVRATRFESLETPESIWDLKKIISSLPISS